MSNQGNKINHQKGPRPHVWKWGKDPFLKEKNIAFLKARCQARYRNETWALDFPTFSAIWIKEKWKQKGIEGDCLCMSRRNLKKGWTKDNVFLIARRDNQLRIKQLRNWKWVKNFTYKGKQYKDYKHLADHYNIEVQTARNWYRFK